MAIRIYFWCKPSEAPPYLAVYLGDGHGNFTQDTNTYYVSTSQSNFGTNATVPSRLNSQAPPLRQRQQAGSLDYAYQQQREFQHLYRLLVKPDQPLSAEAGAHHQHNLTASFTGDGNPGAAITLTASVFGTDPTGSVTFTANGNTRGNGSRCQRNRNAPDLVRERRQLRDHGILSGRQQQHRKYFHRGQRHHRASDYHHCLAGFANRRRCEWADHVNGNCDWIRSYGTVSFASGATSLGKATLANGVATLQTSFAAAGSYPITATYQGDANNLGSTSSR